MEGISGKGLIGRDVICQYLGTLKGQNTPVNARFFYRLVSLGLPARKVAGTWVSNKDKIDGFFGSLTETVSEN